MENYSTKEKASQIGKIALWGPTASGKTWLIHAFGKTLLKYSLHDPDFLYELTNTFGKPLDYVSPRHIESTQEVEDVVFRFRRIGKKDTLAHKISSNEHVISIIDNKGGALTSLNDVRTFESIIDSPNIIIMLDVTRADPNEMTSLSNGYLIGTKEYTEIVQKLLQLLAESPQEERNIAVCLSKSDQISVKGREPISLIKIFFGSDMVNLFEKFKMRPNLNLNFFSISSFGFLPNGKPNYFADDGGRLADETKWEPYNVELPFFWFFENIERKRFSETKKNLFTRLLVRDRSRVYIPYPSLPR